MKILVTLFNGQNSVLDKTEFDISEDGDVSKAVHKAISDWELAVGDTITIEEVKQ